MALLSFEINLISILFLDALTIFTVIRYRKRISSGKIYYLFLFFLFSSFLWVHFSLLSRYPYQSDDLRLILARLSFASSFIFVNSLIYFVMMIGGILEKNLRNPFFIILQALSAVFAALSFSDWIVSRVDYGDTVMQIYFGELYSAAVIFYFLYCIFFLFQIISLFMKTEEPVLKIQLRYILYSMGVAIFVNLIVISIVPLFFSGAPSIMLGQMSILIIFMALAYILMNGKLLILDRQYRLLKKSFSKDDDEQLFRLQKLFMNLQDEFQNNVGSGQRPVKLAYDSKSILIAGDDLPPGSSPAFEEMVPVHLLPEKSAGFLSQKDLLKDAEWISVNDYENIIRSNELYNLRHYGQEFICFSKEFFNLLGETVRYASADLPLLFFGEMGSFRKGLATAAHRAKGGTALMEISCSSLSEYELKKRVNAFLERNTPGEGLLLSGIENLKPSGYDFLENLLPGKRPLYFTASPRIFQTDEFLSHPVYVTLKKYSLETIPFRNRKEDIFFLVLKTVLDFNRASGSLQISKIKREFMERALSLWWTGNAFEIQRVITKEILESKDGVLDQFASKIAHAAIPAANQERLSPLEESEKLVIHETLLKYNYNKTRTKNELGITVNTLNSKIEKYGIQIL